jgi:uncharacterized membrane protein
MGVLQKWMEAPGLADNLRLKIEKRIIYLKRYTPIRPSCHPLLEYSAAYQKNTQIDLMQDQIRQLGKHVQQELDHE